MELFKTDGISFYLFILGEMVKEGEKEGTLINFPDLAIHHTYTSAPLTLHTVHHGIVGHLAS